jgi:ATP-dependent DNA helicase RecQ
MPDPGARTWAAGLVVTPAGRELLHGQRKLLMRVDTETKRKPAALPKALPVGEEAGLRERLKRWRRDTAAEGGIPPYMVFNDRTLEDLIRVRPTRLEDLLDVFGMGARKLDRYGSALLVVLREPEPAKEADIPVIPPGRTAAEFPHESAPAPRPSRPAPSVAASLEGIRRGFSLEEVAGLRRLRPERVAEHLAEALVAGWVTLEEVLQLEGRDLDEALDALAGTNPDLPTAFKTASDALDGRWTREEMRMVAAWNRRQGG